MTGRPSLAFPPPTRPAAGPRPAIRALVVDDDPPLLALLCAFLRARGYTVEASADGADALERMRAGRFNLLLTDRDMPRLDGLALCRAIRALPASDYVYTIMLTGMGEEDSLVAAMEAGVDDFLAKPLRLPELGARLHAAERVLTLEAGLAARNRELGEAYDRLSRELELARTLQTGQLPPPESFGCWRFDWMFEASGFVGGDTFDYFALDERHLCFWQADVSGHGVAAAMLAFHAQHQVRAAAVQAAPALLRGPAGLGEAAVAAASETNRRFLQMKDTSLYFTLLLGLLDRDSGTLALVQAGHPPALLASAPGAPFRPVGEGGVPVGILSEPGYEATVLRLAPGARLALYSDGVTDCSDAQGAAFGLQRLQDLLQAQHGAPLAQAGMQLGSALRAWHGAGAFEDDVTFLGLEVA